MKTQISSLFRDWAVTVAFTFGGVLAGVLLYFVFRVQLFGDKSIVLFPLAMGSLAGSGIGLLFVDRVFKGQHSALGVAIALPFAIGGLFAGVALMDAIAPMAAAVMTPVIVATCSYVPYSAVTILRLNR